MIDGWKAQLVVNPGQVSGGDRCIPTGGVLVDEGCSFECIMLGEG